MPLIALVAIVAAAFRATDPGRPNAFDVVELRDDVFLFRGDGGNALVRLGRTGPVVIDTKSTESGTALRRAIDKLAREKGRSDRPPVAVFLTHHHADHAGGRGAFRDATVYAVDDGAERLTDRERGPIASFTTRLTVRLDDGEVVTAHHKGAGHTDGDAVIHLRQARLLAVGGLVANGLHPALIPEHGADIRGWVRILQGLRRDFAEDRELIVVPGDGPAGGIELIDRQISYLRAVIDLVEDAVRRGQTIEDVLARSNTSVRQQFADFGGERGRLDDLLRVVYRAESR